DINVRRVGAKVGGAESDMLLGAASTTPSFFSAANDNLAGALHAIDPVDDQAVERARYHILITDGVQSTRDTDSSLDCAGGSDQICVRRQVFRLMSRGWHVAIIGLRSEFDGTIYS